MSKSMITFIWLSIVVATGMSAFQFGRNTGESYGIALGNLQMAGNCSYWMEKQEERLIKQCKDKK